MFCNNCGSQVNEEAKFCRECGSEVMIDTETLEGSTCPKCGNLLEENALFCNNCGHKLLENQSEMEFGAKCPHCNAVLKNGAMFCGECGKSVTEDAVDSISSVPKNKKDKGLVFLIVSLIIVLIASVSVIGYIYFQNNSIDIETPIYEASTDDNNEEVLDVEVGNGDMVTDEIEETEDYIEPEYIDDNFNVEDEVLRIRDLYNTTQSNLSTLTKSTSESGKIKYYDSDSKLVRMDIVANSITSYTKNYYFENGELYFAFAFDGTKENRLYFKDNRLFRWIDEAGKTHDKERSNSTFLEWEKIVLDDLNR